MADLSDVESALVSAATNALYPSGVAQGSVVGVTCRIYRGWPSPAALNSDLAAGLVNVTVFPGAAPGEVLAPYFDRLYTFTATANLAATVDVQRVIFSGPVVSNLSVGLLIDGAPFSYVTVASDTCDSIAANLMALISVDRIATLSGPILTVPGAQSLIVRVVTGATMTQELRRQRREVRVSCWCPSPVLRDAVSTAVDLWMAGVSFIGLPDDTSVHVCYSSTEVYDQSQNALLFRRDLCYKCDYTVTSTASAPVMLFGDLCTDGGSSFV